MELEVSLPCSQEPANGLHLIQMNPVHLSFENIDTRPVPKYVNH
jgi:hypothetical protein